MFIHIWGQALRPCLHHYLLAFLCLIPHHHCYVLLEVLCLGELGEVDRLSRGPVVDFHLFLPMVMTSCSFHLCPFSCMCTLCRCLKLCQRSAELHHFNVFLFTFSSLLASSVCACPCWCTCSVMWVPVQMSELTNMPA